MNFTAEHFFWTIVAPVTYGLAVPFAVQFGPIETFARERRTVRCTDYFSVAVHKRKTGWFTFRTEFSVRALDHTGGVIRELSATGRKWNDSKLPEAPEFYCDFKHWPQLVGSSGGGF